MHIRSIRTLLFALVVLCHVGGIFCANWHSDYIRPATAACL